MRPQQKTNNMEVIVSSPFLRFSNSLFPDGSLVRDVLDRFVQQHGLSSSTDFYVVRNGRVSHLEDALQSGAVYHLEPRLRGGKGGFGSMLRALGAQIEKTTNREACRDLSGRRLRDVNHEKEMAEWLQQQTEREAQKEQRRVERLQRKLSEPKHQFSDPEYQRQCHDLSERLEDSVMKGLQVKDGSAPKRTNCDHREQPQKKKQKKNNAAAARFWTGEMLSSEDESSSSSSCGAAPVTMTMHTEEAEPEQSSSSSDASSAPQTSRPAGGRGSPETVGDQTATPSEDQGPPETPRDQSVRPSEDPGPPETARDQTATPETPRIPGRSLVGRSLVDLESLGLEVLKEELMSRGLKCGGTLKERAQRLFSIRDLRPDQINPALLARPAKTKRK
ncbi:splicing regulator SDE2 [Anarrhichthys ocellatus]|uniref:splicing regulator SDE2 n=1 Tax=Anarrhichthys ocellatus TaxID=433405 RepID=UPI0012ED298B|nr:replication stress response regulator SDE2 [Anarrhichthys ocellatus]